LSIIALDYGNFFTAITKTAGPLALSQSPP
jgi:hypothetical protein